MEDGAEGPHLVGDKIGWKRWGGERTRSASPMNWESGGLEACHTGINTIQKRKLDVDKSGQLLETH